MPASVDYFIFMIKFVTHGAQKEILDIGIKYIHLASVSYIPSRYFDKLDLVDNT